MAQNIAPGQKVQIKIVRDPSNQAARKTLVRLLSKDEAIAKENERLRRARARHANPRQRGGRIWTGRVIKQRPVKGQRGEAGTIRATVDVLRDLGSVEKFVEVSPA